MKNEVRTHDKTVQVTDASAQSDWKTERSSCLTRERRRDSEPAIVPSVLFDEETANSVDWKAYYPYYPF